MLELQNLRVFVRTSVAESVCVYFCELCQEHRTWAFHRDWSHIDVIFITIIWALGFGFLTFESEESVEAVCKDRYVDVSNKQVELSLFTLLALDVKKILHFGTLYM